MVVLDYSCKWHYFFPGWIIFHSMHTWLFDSFICPFWLLSCLSCCKRCCSAFLLHLSWKTETVPMRHSVPIPLPQPLAPTILLSVSMEPIALGPLYERTQTSFVLPCLPYVTEHNAVRVHPRCSLWRSCLPFRLDNTRCVDGPRAACPFLSQGHMGYLHSSLRSWSICGVTSESPII